MKSDKNLYYLNVRHQSSLQISQNQTPDKRLSKTFQSLLANFAVF